MGISGAMASGALGVEEYVRYIYFTSIASAMATSVAVDYVLLSLWLWGRANLMALVATPALMFLASITLMTLANLARQIRDGFGKLVNRARLLLSLYTVGVLLVFTYLMLALAIHYSSLDLIVTNEELVRDHYLGLGLVLYNAGLVVSAWQLIEDLIKGREPPLLAALISTFTNMGDKDDGDTVIVR